MSRLAKLKAQTQAAAKAPANEAVSKTDIVPVDSGADSNATPASTPVPSPEVSPRPALSFGGLAVTAPSDKATRLSLLLWGPPGCGKTSYALTAPGRKLLVLLDPDGDASIANLPDVQVLDLTKISRRDAVDTPKSLQFTAWLEKNADAFDTLIFDSATSYARIATSEAVAQKIGASTTFTPTIEQPGISAYGARKAWIVEALTNLVNVTSRLQKHIIITAHEDAPERNQKGELLYITMTITEKAQTDVNPFISEIWHMSRNEREQKILVRNARSFKPMRTRLFSNVQPPEFTLKFDPALGQDQPHALATLYNTWIDGNKQPVDIPK